MQCKPLIMSSTPHLQHLSTNIEYQTSVKINLFVAYLQTKEKLNCA